MILMEDQLEYFIIIIILIPELIQFLNQVLIPNLILIQDLILILNITANLILNYISMLIQIFSFIQENL